MVDDFDTKIDDMENEQDGVLEGAADVDALASDSAAAAANEVDAPEGTAAADAPEDAGAAADSPRIPEFLQHPATGAASRTSRRGARANRGSSRGLAGRGGRFLLLRGGGGGA